MDQTYFNVVSFLVSFLGGGVISALINGIRINRSEKKAFKIKHLEDQITKLYGPLYYFVTQSEKLFNLSDRYHDAYKKEFEEKVYSTDSETTRVLKEESSKTLEIANSYIDHVNRNNVKIEEILNNNASFIDKDDIDNFSMFYEHHIRMITEMDETGKLKVPLKIYRHVGNISFLRPEVINNIKGKFVNKRKELDDLLGVKSQ